MVRRKESPKSLSFMTGNSSMLTLPQRNLSFQSNQPHHYHHHQHTKMNRSNSNFLMNSMMMGTNTRTTLFSKQKQQRRKQLFKVVGFILYSLGLVSLVLILLMVQRLESGRNRSFRVLLNFVSLFVVVVVVSTIDSSNLTIPGTVSLFMSIYHL